MTSTNVPATPKVSFHELQAKYQADVSALNKSMARSLRLAMNKSLSKQTTSLSIASTVTALLGLWVVARLITLKPMPCLMRSH